MLYEQVEKAVANSPDLGKGCQEFRRHEMEVARTRPEGEFFLYPHGVCALGQTLLLVCRWAPCVFVCRWNAPVLCAQKSSGGRVSTISGLPWFQVMALR